MTYSLAAESIEALLDAIEQFCRDKRVEKKDLLLLKLAAEEALLKYAETAGAETPVELLTSSFGSLHRIRICVPGKAMNPFRGNDEFGIMDSLMASMGQPSPQWRYQNSTNLLTFTLHIKKRISPLQKIAIALGLGLTLGLAGRMDQFREAALLLSTEYIQPLADAYTGLLSVMAILMIFFTFPLGVVQLENTASFHSITRRILTSYAGLITLTVLLTFCICLPTLSFSWAGSNVPDAVKSGLDVLLGFVPNNILSPFLNFNCMQVLIVGAMFGFSFLAIGESCQPVVNLFDRCNLVAVLTNNYLTRVIHFYVGMTVFSMVVQADTVRLDMIRSMALILVPMAAMPLLLILVIWARLKVSPRVLCRKMMPSFLINLSSANIGASFTPLFNELFQSCGMEVNYCTISCNLGLNLFKPMYAAFLSLISLRMAALSGMAVTPVWVLLVLFLSAMLSMAIPNIPGGAASVIVLLVSQLGFDGRMSELMVSVNMVLQFLIVPLNVFCLQCLSLLLGARENKVDIEVFRKPLL